MITLIEPMNQMTEQEKLEKLYSTGLSLFSNGLPVLVPRNRSHSISSDPKDYISTSMTERDPSRFTFPSQSSEYVPERGSNHFNSNSSSYFTGGYSNNPSNELSSYHTSTSQNLNQSIPYHYNRYSKPVNHSTEISRELNAYQFPPAKSSYYDNNDNKPTSPAILYSQSLLLSPIDSTRRNSLDYFTLNSNVSAQRHTYSEFDEEQRQEASNDFLTTKFRSESYADRDRRWSITSGGGGGGNVAQNSSTLTSPPLSLYNQRNYYNGGVGRDLRKSSLGDDLPNIGRRGSTISISSSNNSTGNSQKNYHIPQLLASPVSSNSSSLNQQQQQRTIIASPTLSTASTRSNYTNRSDSSPPSPPPEISKAKRLRSNALSSPLISPNSISPPATISPSARTRPSTAPSTSTRSTNSSPPSISQSNAINGGAGSSKGPRSFSGEEQQRLWSLWDGGEYYPSHTVVNQLLKETGLNRSQIRGWFANRRFRAQGAEKEKIGKSRAGAKEERDG